MNLESISAQARFDVVQMSHRARCAHLASALSVVDILVAAYEGGSFRLKDDADTLILSKGHAVSGLYAVLAHCGYIPHEELETYNVPGSRLPEHPMPDCVPGVKLATGSLGHGLPVGLGMALAARIKKTDRQVCVVMSDGECNEGSVWEAAMMAPAQKAGNLTAVVDFNKWQATGRSQEVMALDPLMDKWKAFGWHAVEVDGHDVDALCAAYKDAVALKGQPSAIVAHTVKGKGVSFMEDDNNWHYRAPTVEEVAQAKEELGLA